MRSTRQRAALFFVAIATLIVVACETGQPIDPGTGEAAWVAVSPRDATISAIDASVQLDVVDRSGRAVTSTVTGISWRAVESGIVQVEQTGRVTAVTPGTARIVVESSGANDTATVRVRQNVSAMTVSPASPNLVAGATQQLTATLRDANGHGIVDRAPSWSTSASGVATVSSSGLVTAQGAGTATITATIEGRSATATVTVTAVPPAPVATVAVSPATASPAVGQTQQFTATLRDAGGAVLTGRAVGWSTSAAGVATVSGSGLVTAVAAGSATITATSEGRSGTATVTVPAPAPVATVTVSPATASPAVGQTQQLTATLRDAAGAVLTGRAVTWTTSAAGVATVSGSGLVTAIAVGTATITATSEGRTGTAAVTVMAPSAQTVDTVFYDGFESGSLNDPGRWQDIFSSGASIVTAANEGITPRTGARVMKIQPPGVAITHFFAASTPYSHIRFSYSMWRNAGFADGGLRAGGIRGSATQWGSFGIGGACPDSRPEEFFALYLTLPQSNNWALRLYNYWLGEQKMQVSPPVCIGTSATGPNDRPQAIYHDINFAPAPGRWYRYEVELRLNTPGMDDGYEKVWVDGVLKIEHNNVRYRNNPLTRIWAITFDVGAPTNPGSFAYFDDVLVTVNRTP